MNYYQKKLTEVLKKSSQKAIEAVQNFDMDQFVEDADQFLALKKQRGALLAKGRLLGVQFDALFTDDLYFRIGEYAIEKAEELKAIFEKHRIEIYLPSPTNQQFIILSNERAEKLQDTVSVSFWEELNETHTIFRLATSWSTTEEDLKALDDAFGAL